MYMNEKDIYTENYTNKYINSKKPLVFSIISFGLSVEFFIFIMLGVTPLDWDVSNRPTDVTYEMALIVILVCGLCLLVPFSLFIVLAIVKGKKVWSKKYLGFTIPAISLVILSLIIAVSNFDRMIEFVQYIEYF